MSEKKHKIPWTDKTWNPIVGCTKVSAGCENCYAEKMAHRVAHIERSKPKPHKLKYGEVIGYGPKHHGKWNNNVVCDEKALEIPLHWREPRRIFVNSMGDTFHEKVPFEFIDKMFAVMALCPQHTFQVLTKRPERMLEYFTKEDSDELTAEDRVEASLMDGGYPVMSWPLPNVWLGTTCENQEMADLRIPHLLQCPAAVRFVSAEPLLGDIDFSRSYGEDYYCSKCGYCGEMDIRCCVECSNGVDGLQTNETDGGHCSKCGQGTMTAACPNCETYTGQDDGEAFAPVDCYHEKPMPGIDQVIVGAESLGGSAGRECRPEWVRNIVRQCKAAGVAVFVKQIHMWKTKNDPKYYETMFECLQGGKVPYQDISKIKRVLLKYPRDKDLFPKDLRCWEYPGEGLDHEEHEGLEEKNS